MRIVRILRIFKILSTFSKKEPTFDVGVINEEIAGSNPAERKKEIREVDDSRTLQRISGYNPE